MDDINTDELVDQTIEVEARNSTVTVNSVGTTTVEDHDEADQASIIVDPDIDGDGFLGISTFVNIDHEGERLEVAGYFEIHDEADARRLAAAVLAPWA